MSQSSIIGATLLAAFILFLAANDRLKVYAAVLWGDTKAPLPSSSIPPAAAPGASGPGGLEVPGLGGGSGGGLSGLLEEAGPLLLEAL